MDDVMKAGSLTYEYYICEFVGCLNSNGQYEMDILPKEWIVFYRDLNKLTAPYPDPPYTPKLCDKLQESIKLLEQPDPNWKKWDVALRGGARKLTWNLAFLTY